MKIALLMPGMDTGEMRSNSGFRFLHDLSRSKLWNQVWSPITRKFFHLDNLYPTGLVQLATILKANHDVKIFNFLQGADIQEVIDYSPDVVGFTCSAGGNLVWIDKMSRFLKSQLGCLIFLGGPHVSLLPEQSLRTTVADYVFVGESDWIVPQVLEFIEGKADSLPTEGVCYWKDGDVVVTPNSLVSDLSQLPIPDHTILDLKDYRTIGVQLSRGCHHRCSFCYLSGYEKYYSWRHRPTQAVVQELVAISERVDMKGRRVSFVDDSFTGNEKAVRDVLKAIIDLKLNLSFWSEVDVNTKTETLELMKEAGCSFVYAGIETAEEDFLRSYASFKNRDRSLSFVRSAKEQRIAPSVGVMLMLPDETKAHIRETLKFCKEMARIPMKVGKFGAKMIVYPHIFRPVPGTPLAEELEKRGWEPPQTFENWGYFYDDISNGRLEKANFTADVSRGFLIWTLLQIAWMNFQTIIISRMMHALGRVCFPERDRSQK
ncbi:MAG: radical SAM protein [Candidatus Omnitrophica bacterium]|nr:radical SAM protein [Candidatus Omnitrophota bacterium]